MTVTKEEQRLQEDRQRKANWKRWGPYLSERQWGTVREDYSAYGAAWDYFPHDHARSRAYRWGEDGIAGISDRHQYICFALALWNGKDPILKERLFGLTGNEGNHGEDVKEYYFYLDSTPTHSYMKFLYKYPQAEFPYARLVEENRKRSKRELEFELINTGIFDDEPLFRCLRRIRQGRAGRHSDPDRSDQPRPRTRRTCICCRRSGFATPGPGDWTSADRGCGEDVSAEVAAVKLDHYYYGSRWLYCEGSPELLFTENETNKQQAFQCGERLSLRQRRHQRLHRARR